MSACQDVRKWVTQNILVPVTKFITEAKQKCEEVRQRYEEKITQPVERWVSQQERRCRKLPWWNPLRWFCELVTIVVKVIEWVVVTVVKWVITIVCQVVTVVVGIVITFVLRVIGWFVTFVVCLFTDPLEALKSFRDLWSIVVDTVGEIFDFVKLLLDDIDGILGDIEHLLDSLATSLGWLGVVLGIIKGIIHLVRDLVSIVKDIVSSIGEILQGILGLNWCRLLRGLTNLGTSIGRILLATGFAPVALLFGGPLAAILLLIRIVGAAVGGVRDSVDLHRLEEVITDSLNQAFGDDQERIDRSIERVGIGANPMGLPFTADARRLFLSSDNRDLNLRDLHDKGLINLYALAGYLSGCRGTINEPEGEVVYAGTDLKVSYADLETFLNEGPGSVPEFHVFAITRAKFRQHLAIANRKAAALGLQLFFPTIDSLQATSLQHLPLNATDPPPPDDSVQQQLFQRLGRTGTNDDLATIPAISHFHYVLNTQGNELFGLTSWFRPSDRDARLSGVTYRNRTPNWVFQWVLVHELGHYWGQNHKDRSGNDRSLDQIMYAPSTGVGLTVPAVLEFLLLGGEPRFTLDDARTTWDWITSDGAASLLP